MNSDSANLCGEHDTGYRYDPCAACLVVGDLLEDRGIKELPSGLMSGYGYHPQEWGFRELEEIALDINDGSDETNYTWILKIAGRWAAVRGWHDYTGWDCQSALKTEWYESKDAAFRTLVDWERELIESNERIRINDELNAARTKE